MVDDARQRHFVTVDDLDDKDWLGDNRNEVFDGLGSAFARLERFARLASGSSWHPSPRDGTVVRRSRMATPFPFGHSAPDTPTLSVLTLMRLAATSPSTQRWTLAGRRRKRPGSCRPASLRAKCDNELGLQR